MTGCLKTTKVDICSMILKVMFSKIKYITLSMYLQICSTKLKAFIAPVKNILFQIWSKQAVLKKYTYVFLLLSPPAKCLHCDVMMHAVHFQGKERDFILGPMNFFPPCKHSFLFSPNRLNSLLSLKVKWMHCDVTMESFRRGAKQ